MIRQAMLVTVTVGLLQGLAGGALAQYDTRYDESGIDRQFDTSGIDREFDKSGIQQDDLTATGLDHSDLDPTGLDQRFDDSGIDNPTNAPPIQATPGGQDLDSAPGRAN